MTQDSYEFDGTVRVEEIIKHYRFVPQNIYEVTRAFDLMTEEEQIKVLKYITRITNKRITFRALQKPMSKRQFFRKMKELMQDNEEKSVEN